jgi:pyrimidine-nucleoside phosphorylase
MDVPLGNAIGNALEVQEAVDTLRGKGPKDLTDVCVELSAYMLLLAGVAENVEDCKELARNTITSGEAFERFCAMTREQGGDDSVLKNGFKKASVIAPVLADKSGYITKMDTEACGIASLELGAGRHSLEDSIDYSAGIVLCKKTGDKIAAGDTLAMLHTSDSAKLQESEDILKSAIAINDTPPTPVKIVQAVVMENEVIM